MPSVVGVLGDREAAERIIPTLVDQGIDPDTIGLMWRDKTVRQPEEIKVASYHDHHGDPGSEAGKGALGGAIGGASVGAGTMLLASGGLALIPGIGAFLAAGTIAATAGAAAVGAGGGTLAGGLLGAINGASDDDATKTVESHHRYREAIARDGFLISVETHDRAEAAEVSELMESAGAVDVSILNDRGS